MSPEETSLQSVLAGGRGGGCEGARRVAPTRAGDTTIFTPTEEQHAMREMAHDFAAQVIRPVAWDYDKDGTWPQAIIRQASGLGLMNSHLPAMHGGVGASYLD